MEVVVDREQERTLVKAAAKNAEAFGQLYDAFFPKILAYAYRRTGDLVDAEEAASETFFKALKNIGKFRWRGGGFLPWLYRIAGNEVVNVHRKRRKGEASGLLDLLPAPVRDEVEEAETKRQGKRLAHSLSRALSLLDRRDQEIVVLHYLQDEPYSLIAETLKMKESTIRVKAMRALRRLEDLLRKEGWDHGKASDAGWATGLSGSGAEVPSLPETATGV
jgi:RNA polymerase sigma-70 factor, ECF subfamily